MKFSLIFKTLSLLIIIGFLSLPLQAKEKQKKIPPKSNKAVNSSLVSGLKFRNVGPAVSSGRIADFAVNPNNPSEYYVGTASGGLWKTTNHGTTFKPVFDHQPVYSIGALAMDPNNHNVVWAGTGENNSQRNLAYGDGVYKTINGGKSWKNMGLKSSEHIGKIMIDPRNSDVVYVCSQGPAWGPGGERGLYKTTDGGKTWKAILTISENTGVSDMEMDPRNPDVLYAASHQRRRRVFTKIDGGPESRIYKSTDGGANWKKLTKGIPGGDVGRIGLALSPVNPDVIYALIELPNSKGGFYRSENRGETWSKKSIINPTSPQYYQEIYCDPVNVNRVYMMDTRNMVTEDGGIIWKAVGEKSKHVDNHALWIDPDNTDYLLAGCDGGVYESYDRGKNWVFKNNLPITQFYHVKADNAYPFYNLYGGAQDNGCWTGPSQTLKGATVNADWIPTNGGDGYVSMSEPGNPNIVYAESQYGGMARYDRQSGENLRIQPQPKGDESYRFNWNTPFFVSSHSKTRLYAAANKVFQSDDRGESWKEISPDLSKQIDVNSLKVMGKLWGPDAVAKSLSTSLYGNIFSLTESPVQEGLLYAGTDDGLIQVTENNGKSWTRYATFPGIPESTFVTYLLASEHDVNTVYAAFDGRKNSDFKPYLLKSTDKGKTWTSISSNLPDNGTVYVIQEDFKDPRLLFVGTEFGAFFSNDGGQNWVKLKSGLPSIPVKDMCIQKRENDLCLATFGRGFYILDDYSALRDLKPNILSKEGHIFPIKTTLNYIQSGGLYGQGEVYYRSENPGPEAVFTYYLKNSLSTLKQKRKKREAAANKKKIDITYPTREALMAEDKEESPYLLFTVLDSQGKIVNRIQSRGGKGINRVNWNLHYMSQSPPRQGSSRFRFGGRGPAVPSGNYSVVMYKSVNGQLTKLDGPVSFEVKQLENSTLKVKDQQARVDFDKKAQKLSARIQIAVRLANEASAKMKTIKQTLKNAESETEDLNKKATMIYEELFGILTKISGSPIRTSRVENNPPTLSGRIGFAQRAGSRSTYGPTKAQEEQYEIAAKLFPPLLQQLNDILDVKIPALEKELDAKGIPWTPGRKIQID